MHRLGRTGAILAAVLGVMAFVLSSAPLNALAREQHHPIGPRQTLRLWLPNYPLATEQAAGGEAGADLWVRRNGAGIDVVRVVLLEDASGAATGTAAAAGSPMVGPAQTVAVQIRVLERSRFLLELDGTADAMVLRTGATSNAQRRVMEARLVPAPGAAGGWEPAGLIQGPTGNAAGPGEAMQWSLALGSLPLDGEVRVIQFRVR